MEGHHDNKPVLNDDPAVTLTIRLIMQGKEVGSIIGKKGEIVKRFREESGAKINISDGSCPERIVTVTGPTNSIFKAFTLICKKFEEWCAQFNENLSNANQKPPITLRLIVPASQCGSLIGKGGSKIKEIREVTGASIQVASEMLPNSTERAVTISGTSEAITQCIYHICCVMLESPPKGATIPYRPKPQVGGPVILAGGQAFTIQGNYAVPAHSEMGKLGSNPLAGLAALGLGGLANPANAGGLNPAVLSISALAALAGSQLRSNNQNRQQQPQANNQTQEMTVPNELIGCIIGKGGTKIAEIRQISGAMIRISNCEDRESAPTDRTITITGSADAVALAQYLINMSVELQKANLEAQNTQNPGNGTSPTTNGSTSSNTNTTSPLASAIPLAQLLSKPGALNALSSLSALGGLTELLGGALGGGSNSLSVQTTGVHRSNKNFTPRLRSPNGAGPVDNGKFKSERAKFNPY